VYVQALAELQVQEQELSTQLKHQEQSVVAMKTLNSADMHAHQDDSATTAADSELVTIGDITVPKADAAAIKAALEADTPHQDRAAELADANDGFEMVRYVLTAE
jgi:hypothetical protein